MIIYFAAVSEVSVKPAEVVEVISGGIASGCGLKPGDKIISINGRILRDILDYELSAADDHLELEVIRGKDIHIIKINNPNLESLGIRFSTSLFDGMKTCANKCIFCFIDQLPPGMRETVYVKDDDYRLSFLYGNFVTLTNTRDADIERIISDRISPLYVSLHTTDPDLRSMMLGRKKADKTMSYLKRLSDAGIDIHIQMVLCPGVNDGEQLEKSISDLSENYLSVSSVGLVPVGLTGHRDSLASLRSFEKQEIISIIGQVGIWQERFEKDKDCAWVYIADEFYISVGYDIPQAEHYCEFPQIENGIGLSRLFLDEVDEFKVDIEGHTSNKPIAIVTGEMFAHILKGVVEKIGGISDISANVIGIINNYFGGKVNVTGLLTGSDIIKGVSGWLKENPKPDVLVIPDIVLNDDGLTLDGYLPERIAQELDIKVEIFESSGSGLIKGLMGV